MVEAAGLPETVFTVFANVFEGGRLRAGETLMVHGATSGIGVTAIQMGKAAGAVVIATGRGADKAIEALALGADRAVDASSEDFVVVAKDAGGVDVVLDMVGGDYVGREFETLNTGGRIVMIATLGGANVELNLGRVMQKRAVITGSTLRPRDANEKARLAGEVERVVWPWVEAGDVRTIIDTTFPLAEAAKAHARLDDSAHTGKIVLVV
jgi:NADPH:quinone reductase-like Zn-dependent oxidoreductase